MTAGGWVLAFVLTFAQADGQVTRAVGQDNRRFETFELCAAELGRFEAQRPLDQVAPGAHLLGVRAGCLPADNR